MCKIRKPRNKGKKEKGRERERQQQAIKCIKRRTNNVTFRVPEWMRRVVGQGELGLNQLVTSRTYTNTHTHIHAFANLLGQDDDSEMTEEQHVVVVAALWLLCLLLTVPSRSSFVVAPTLNVESESESESDEPGHKWAITTNVLPFSFRLLLLHLQLRVRVLFL